MPLFENTIKPAQNKYSNILKWGTFYFIIYLFIHIHLIHRQGLHIDEVIDFNGSNSDIYLAAGRWGLFWYRKVMGTGIFPITAGLIAGIYIAIAIFLQTSLFKFDNNFLRGSYGLIYIACNQWQTQLEYSHQSDAVALALLLCTIGVYLLSEENKKLFLSILCFTLAVSVYQTCALYFLVIWSCFIVANRQLNIRNVAHFTIVSIISLAVYFAIAHFFKHSDLITVETRLFVTKYQSNLSQWDEFINLDFRTQALFILHYCKTALVEALGFSKQSSIFQPFIIIPLIYLIVIKLKQGFTYPNFLYALVLVGIWIEPFLMHIILPGYTPTRTLLAEPVALGFLSMATIKHSPCIRQYKNIILIGIGFVLLKAAYSNTANARNSAHHHNLLVRELNNMHLAGNLLAQQNGIISAKIILLHEPNKQSKKHPYVHLNLIYGILDRNDLHWYTSHLRLSNLIQSDSQLYEKHKNIYHEMPCWPEAGSIRIHQGDIIIRVTP